MSSRAQSNRKLTYQEYVLLPSDGMRHEIIDGRHIVNPAPETYHQTLSRRIQFQLFTQIELSGRGQVFNAPTDLQLSEFDVVQPDLIVVLNDNKEIITKAKIEGTPDLVVEILSKSSADHDRITKKNLYLGAGVPEYWIVDPHDQVVDQFVLRDGKYLLLGRQAASVAAEAVSGVVVDLSEVW